MAQQAISTADLHTIENNLATIYNNLSALDSNVSSVDKNVRVVYDEIGSLSKEFQAYMLDEKRRWELENATTRLGNIRQELDTKFGHYAEVRRTTTGILQATDLGIVHNDTITDTVEDLMLTCPDYWLAPALVALAAWINDEKETAEKAVKEALRRDDERTSLLFGLICRRANRYDACLKWVKRYLMNQDPAKLGRETIVVLDAYASGLFANDSEGVIAQQLADWLAVLSEKPDFLDRQTSKWKTVLNDQRKPISTSDYTYLRQYSHTWPLLQDVLEGARLHQTVLEYFEGVFAQPSSQAAVKRQLDDILSSLVTGFDDEEVPLKRDERLCQLIIEYEGDVKRANQSAKAESTTLDEEKDFTELLTDAAMYPDATHSGVASQKFSIAYSREWIGDAYRDLTAENRAKVPNFIEINIDTFDDRTEDGSDEERLSKAFNDLVTKEKTDELDKNKLTPFETYCMPAGIVVAVIGLLMLVTGNGLLGVIAIVAGIGMLVNHFSKKKIVEARRDAIEKTYEEKREKGSAILRATLAEIVDFRSEFQLKDAESSKVNDFLNQITPDEYVKTVSGSTRKINAD